MPPTRIPDALVRTERLVLRCWEAADAPLLKDAIDTSLEHLRVWMPWAWQEPSELAVVVDRRDSRNADGTARDTMVWELTAAEYRAPGTGAGAPEG